MLLRINWEQLINAQVIAGANQNQQILHLVQRFTTRQIAKRQINSRPAGRFEREDRRRTTGQNQGMVFATK